MIFTSFRCDILFKLTLQAARGGLEVVYDVECLAGGGDG